MKKHGKYDTALKEIEILNLAIARQEDIGLKIRGWCITLITALTIAFLSNELITNKETFFWITLFVIFLFYHIETLHRVAEIRAIRRSQRVEKIMRLGLPYDGPDISRSLVFGRPGDKRKAWFNPRIFWTYFFLFAFALVIYIVNADSSL